MAIGNPGADSSMPVTDDLVNTATQQFGQTPLVLGPLLHEPDHSRGR
jgi:hypothetical protein